MWKDQQYTPSEILISVREPYDKHTVWIHPHNNVVEIKIFDDKSWKIISTTEDKGLSPLQLKQVQNLIEQLKDFLMKKLQKYFNKFSTDFSTIFRWKQNTNEQITTLDNSVSKLSKKQQQINKNLIKNGY